VTAVLVRDLALERWPSMDRYAEAIAGRLGDVIVPAEWRTLGGPRYLTRYWTYPRALRRYRGDLVHVLDHSYAHCLRAFRGVPSVVTVHDLLPLRTIAAGRLGLRSRVRNRLLQWVLDWVPRADRVIVTTQYTAREAGQFIDVDPQRIRIIPMGVDGRFFDRPAEAALAARRAQWIAALGGAEPPAALVLHVGSCHPRKNVEAAIAALGILRAHGVDAALVQIGGAFGPAHVAAIREAGVAAHVVQEREVAEDALVAAYYAADALVLPSSFEGWGLPAVEAMAAGLPVVTSGAAGLREAVGEAGLVVGGMGADPIAAALERVLTDPALRADLAAKGRARAASLTWDRCASQTRAVHDELLGR